MLKYSLCFLFVAACVHANDEDAQIRIIKGRGARYGKILYVASVQINGQGHRCGGTLIDSQWVLTAGHCVDRVEKIENLRVVLGTHSLKAGGQEFNVTKATVHSDFNRAKLINDIALLKLSKPVEFSDKVQAIPLPEKDTDTGANVMVSGWGSTDNHQDAYPDQLQTLNQTALSVHDCKSILGEEPNEKRLCTVGQKKGSGLCVRDGGNPLVEGNTLVGVASFVLFECGSKFPNGYARVFAYMDWIKNNMS